MAYDGHSVSWFAQYYALDQCSSRSAPCIYFKRNGERCTLSCSKSDTMYAKNLRQRIDTTSGQTVDLDMLQQYILYNCCKKGQHRRIMAEDGLLDPLTSRWRDEISRDQISSTEHRDETQTRSAPSRSSRYNLRSSPSSDPSASIEDQLITTGFRPHIVRPGPTDSVFHKMQVEIRRGSDNDKSGWVYMFQRASSPGHVKIGWSSCSVESRIDSWSRCGYVPEFLFKTDRIPHARLVESLVHYELLHEWRREYCVRCRHDHKEWFEVDQLHAMQVVKDWADWMTLARPYDSNGHLRPMWQRFIEDLDRRWQLVSAKTLLQHHYAITRVSGLVTEVRSSQPADAAQEQSTGGRSDGSLRPPPQPPQSRDLRALVERVIREIIARNPNLDLAAVDAHGASTAVAPLRSVTSVVV